MQIKFSLIALTFIGSAFLTACNNYSVSVNDKTVYTPAPLFKDYQLADAKLKDCVEQTISDLNVTKADDLIRLNCSDAGITSVAGLDKFFALAELNLANNQLSDINELGNLGRLEVLVLNNNQIKNPAPLLSLLHLQTLDLTKNPNMACKDLYQLAQNLSPNKPQLKLPEQCNKG
ncbi:leucine-rich repeat domain-containing protein [Cellvibrio mixtus]|uniref:leucine-rich repeat domain-containing protein n=1 Tax=Cellvibrio mixtus TaxID=39650 RepID=UPI000586FEA1|nr:leucine-rich repeat domain-containing protein [Cellvibrio mixtus]